MAGTIARGIKTPIISKGDNLVSIVADSVLRSAKADGFALNDSDIIAVTESVVAISQGNYASLNHIAADVSNKFKDEEIGIVFPITSRNRFLNILKGIAKGAKKVYVLLNFPQDEMGNPVVDPATFDHYGDNRGLFTTEQFKAKYGDYKLGFTDVNYFDLYKNCAGNVEVYASQNPLDILKLTKNVIVSDIHTRERTKNYLLKGGAKKVYTLADFLNSPVNGSGYNKKYGLLGANYSNEETVKLFPENCDEFVNALQQKMLELTGKKMEALIYGDGAFKDPVLGIWELADPVVSPAYTQKLGGQPNEIKLKKVADGLNNLTAEEKERAVKEIINSKGAVNSHAMGTTPRKYADLVGSLCDLVSGSGDKGTPVVLVQNYFTDWTK